MFDINYLLLAYRLIKVKYRNAFTLDWLWVKLSHVQRLQNELLVFRKSIKEEVIWGRSKLAVETLIRDTFGNNSINLLTQIVTNREWLVMPFSMSSLTPIITPTGGDVIIRNHDDTVNLQNSQLIVEVSLELQNRENEIKSFLKDYLHVGIIYQIQYT